MNIFGLFGPSNPELQFTRLYFKKLKKKIQGLALVSLKELEIKTKFKGNDLTHYLNNAYAEYVREKYDKNEIIDRYIRAALTLYQPKPEYSHDRIVPNIRDRRYLEELRRIRQNKEIEYVYEEYNDELYIFYAQDTEHSISYLVKDNIEEYSIETAGLKERAIKNLLNILPNIESQGENGYFMLTAGGNYEASLILVESIWTPENFNIKGEIVIGVPARDLVLITGSEDKEGLERLKSTVFEVNQTGNHLVSDKLYIYQNGKFAIFGQ
ncbi:MAG: DUF1444 family protein [Lewinellaceae bacterium]|nr:DUF1444 family protein [Lewinellaceae bacterium]